jgi:hypothetical protein
VGRRNRRKRSRTENVGTQPESFPRLPIPLEAALLTGKAFLPIPDFFIGAHAALSGLRLLTRDSRRWTKLPSIAIIGPVRIRKLFRDPAVATLVTLGVPCGPTAGRGRLPAGIARPPPWIPPESARGSPPAPLWRAGEWPFPRPPGSDTIPIACRPAVQCTPFHPAGLALLPSASPPYGPPDRSLFVVEIVITWPVCSVT